PKGLIHELLPTTDAPLPLALHKKRLPALLLERLNYDGDSPLLGRIRTPTPAGGTIKDNSILKMLENSISDGALYPYRFATRRRARRLDRGRLAARTLRAEVERPTERPARRPGRRRPPTQQLPASTEAPWHSHGEEGSGKCVTCAAC